MADPVIAVLVPVLGRPERAAPLSDSLDSTVTDTFIAFVCNEGDDEQIDACHNVEHVSLTLVVPWQPGKADYARKINYAFRELRGDADWFLTGADDLRFHPGWDEAALAKYEETRCAVIGTNDLGNRTVMRGLHATHSLVHRDYGIWSGTVDGPNELLAEHYWHDYVDNECIETAKARGQFAFAVDSHVEHLHPFWRKGADDATYERGREHYQEDGRTFQSRRRLWQGR